MSSLTDPILKQGIEQLKTDIGLTHEIVHGNENVVVQTEGGPVKSFAKLQQENQQKIDGFLPSLDNYEPKNNGDTANGFPRLSNFRLAIISAVTKARTYFVGTSTQDRLIEVPDKSGKMALLDDITGINSGVNTGDETQASILQKLGATKVTGSNTGDQTLEQLGGQPLLGFVPVDNAVLGQPNGVATLDTGGKVPASQLPSFVDDVLEFPTENDFPQPGERGKIYVAIDSGQQFRWAGSFYLGLVASPGSTDAVPEGSVNKYFTESRVLNTLLAGYTIGANAVLAATDSIKTAFGKLQKQISDILPILAAKADSNNPTFTGYVQVPNLASDDRTKAAANSTFVQTLINNLYNQIQGGSPPNLKTIAALAAAINNDPNFVTTVNNLLAEKEMLSNKVTSFGVVNNVVYPTVQAVKSYVDQSLVKVVYDCGGWDASGGEWPAAGGTGPGGSVVKGNMWFVSVAGTLGGVAVTVGDSFRALEDNPGQDATKWAIMEHNFNYVPANKAGDTMGFLNISGTGRALFMTGLTDQTKSLGISNGNVTMDFGLESINGGDIINGAASYGASWNTSGGSLNFGIQKNNVMTLTKSGAKIVTSAANSIIARNSALSLMQTTAGNEVNLELGDGTNPSVKFSYIAGVLYLYVNGAVRAKWGLDGVGIFDDIKRTTGETYWHSGNLQPGQANGVAQLDAGGKVPATQMPSTNSVSEGANNLYFTEARVLATKLTGYAVATVNAALAAGDSVLTAFGKIQKQFNDLAGRTTTLETNNTGVNTGDETQARILSKLGATTVTGSNTGDETRATIVTKLGNTDSLPEGATNLYFTQARAVASVLTGYAVAAVNAVVAATDTVSAAIGKLQKQISDLGARTTGTNTGDETRTTIVNKLGYDPVNPALLGANNGIATLDGGGKVPASQLPSFVDDVMEFANLAAFPNPGEAGKIYVALDDNKTYRWAGSSYIIITASPGSTDAVPEGSVNLYFTASRVLGTVLSGLSTATNAVISAGDTVLSALGKLQKQLSDLAARTTGTNTGDETQTTIFNKIGYTPMNPANIGNYAPSLTGGGASGTWGINITGNAASASNASALGGISSTRTMQKRRTRISSADGTSLDSSISSLETGFTYGGSGETVGPFIHFGGLGADADYGCQMVANYQDGSVLMFRTKNDDATPKWNPWRTIWHSGNLALSVSALGYTVVQRNANGYILGNYVYMSDDGTTGGNGNGTAVTGIIAKQGDDYYRTVSASLIKQYLDLAGFSSTAISAKNVTFSGFMTETVVSITANTASTVLDLSLGTVFKVTIAANTTITFDTSKLPAGTIAVGKSLSISVITINDATAGRGVSFGGTIQWTDGIVPGRTTAANARDDWTFYNDSGATTWVGSLSNQNVK